MPDAESFALSTSVPLGAPSLGLIALHLAEAISRLGLLDAVYGPLGGRVPRHLAPYKGVPVRSVPYIGRHRLGRAYQFALRDAMFDWQVAARHRGRTNLVSTSGMCLRSMVAARKRGRRTVLLAPTSHIRAQELLVSRERVRLGMPAAPSETNGVYRRRQLEEYDEADLILTLSQQARRTFIDLGIAAERTRVVYLGVDVDSFPHATLPPDGPIKILFLGQIGVRKGVHTLLDACALLPREMFTVTLVGDWEPEAKARFGRMWRPNFTHRPFTDDVARVIADHHLLVLPSVEDGFGLVVLEAMCIGRPAIVSDMCGVSELVAGTGAGRVFRAGDVDDLSAAIMAFSDPHVVASAGDASRALAEKHSWRAWYDRVAAEIGP